MAKKRMYSFAKEKHSGKGILSTILGTLSLVIFAVLAWLAYYLDGQAGRLPGQHRAAWHGICRQQCRVRTDGIWRKQCALPVSEDWVDPRRHHGGIVGICSFNWDLRKCQGELREYEVWNNSYGITLL